MGTFIQKWSWVMENMYLEVVMGYGIIYTELVMGYGNIYIENVLVYGSIYVEIVMGYWNMLIEMVMFMGKCIYRYGDGCSQKFK